MATQGIVSIRQNGKMLFKAVAGSNGANARKLAALLKDISSSCTAEEVHRLAVKAGFGHPDTDLIVQGREGMLHFDRSQVFEEDLGPFYRDESKFNDPEFNPRWQCGVADYIEIVDLQNGIINQEKSS